MAPHDYQELIEAQVRCMPLRAVIDYWSHRDGWGVACVYLNTLHAILDAAGIEVDLIPEED